MTVRLGLAALLVVVAFTVAHGACGSAVVGLFGDDQAVLCQANTALYSTTTVYLFLFSSASAPLRSVEVNLAGWPSGEGGLITPHWEHFPDSGDLGSTLRWEWPEGLDDALSLFLGSIDIFVLEEGWPGQDWIVDAEIQSIEDIYHQIPPHRDLQFVFNCTGQVECECGWGFPAYNEPSIEASSFSPAPGASVAGSFAFNFHVMSVLCEPYGGQQSLPYTGSLLVNDELVADLAGNGSGEQLLTLDTGDLPAGSTMSVRVLLDNGASTQAQLDYVVDTSTGVPDPPTADGEMSVSAIKSRY